MAFSLFGSRRSAQQPQAPAPTPAPVPGGAAAPAPAPAPDDDPNGDSALAAVRDAWKMPIADPKQTPQPQGYFTGVDPAKLQAAAQSINFLQGVDPALMEKAKAGDADAFMQVINASNQAAFQTAMLAIPSIMEPVLKQVEDKTTAKVPGLFRQQALRSARAETEILNDPAYSPIFEALKTTIAATNPQATPEEITQLAERHFGTLATTYTKATAAPAPRGGQNAPAADDQFDFLL